jgi:hypothetical protein
MKDTALHKIKQIKSNSHREKVKYLLENGHRITYFEQAWSNESADCIYFDSKLDLEKQESKFKLNGNVIIHENIDPKSGTERGFIDNETGEGLIGKLT